MTGSTRQRVNRIGTGRGTGVAFGLRNGSPYRVFATLPALARGLQALTEGPRGLDSAVRRPLTVTGEGVSLWRAVNAEREGQCDRDRGSDRANGAVPTGQGHMVEQNLLARLREMNPRYSDAAYLFLLSALQFAIDRLDEPRHITGRELAESCRDLAIQQYGPMARTVLEHWGIHSTADMGAIVYALIECHVLIKQDTDSQDDFEDVFDFEETFDRDYPWGRLKPHR